ncbi:murein hydrolase activator EnvC family protein [Evansella cellulosilytica]|uniref:Peptidase M23 n=1 Tax=Evansella cellulosilytica (strain ATCC 21833 / DSM 2522 / FERM P-1141 / JCM 9156 / N-4) TaxID=649639 RepID=E6TQU7_EVAC2|nr:peptidoglycan DD-metalloendopeptidase family protein [Evansella cellulosilytica]ADU31722.1 Peptidase M23 [Evansella cellulosilytica DSM 2522]
MFKKIMLTFILIFGLLSTTVIASEDSDLLEKINSYQNQRDSLDREAELLEQELGVVELEIEEMNQEISRLDEYTMATSEAISEKNKEIYETEQTIIELEEEITIIEKRIEQRDELLKERLRSIYQNGSVVRFLEVILGAQSFGDFIERVIAINTISQQDRNIIDMHMEDIEKLAFNQQNLEEELMSLETQLNSLEKLEVELEEQKIEKGQLLEALVQKEGTLQDQVVTVDEERANLEAQESAAQQELADREAIREQERELQQQAEVQNNTSNDHVSNNYDNDFSQTSGILQRPATGRITTGFEMRWGQMHYGIDIGKNGRTGDVPVIAAESGTVIRSYYSTSYGNTVMIRHNINGQTITTLYAHLENRAVNTGDTVSRGQFLGNMGNTGRSFGPHLHFEVHEGDWNASKSNAVDPMKYIN